MELVRFGHRRNRACVLVKMPCMGFFSKSVNLSTVLRKVPGKEIGKRCYYTNIRLKNWLCNISSFGGEK